MAGRQSRHHPSLAAAALAAAALAAAALAAAALAAAAREWAEVDPGGREAVEGWAGAIARCRGLPARLRARQDGQLTILLVGLVLLVLMTLALGWDTSNWLIGRRALNDLADGAAVAAAGAVDVERFRATGGREVTLSQAAADAAVRELLATSRADGVTAAVSTGTGPGGRPQATVRLRAPAATTFLHLLGMTAPEMSAEAVAVAVRVRPRSP